MEDETCKGRLECALRKDAPADLVRTDEIGRTYFIGDPLVGYTRLCRSHHMKYDFVIAGYYQSEAWKIIAARGGRLAGASAGLKGACSRWAISRGRDCICGKH